MDRKHVANTASDSEEVQDVIETSVQPTSRGRPPVERASTRRKASAHQSALADPRDSSELLPASSKPKKKSKQTNQQRPLLIAGYLVAAAIATACVRQWLKRRKLRPKTHSVEHLITRCSLEPSSAVQNASPPPPLHSTNFVVSQV